MTENRASVIVSYKQPDVLLMQSIQHILVNQPFELLLMSGGTEANDAQRGLEAATGEVVLFTNSDTLVPLDWVERHLQYYPEYEAVLGATAYNLRSLAFRNFSAKRKTLLKYGFKDISNNNGRGNCWDTELGIRMERDNLKCKIDPSIKVLHAHPGGYTTYKRLEQKFNASKILIRTRTSPSLEDIKHSLDFVRKSD